MRPSDHLAPFPAWSLTLPAPLPFPRDLYADALAEHVQLLSKYAEHLLFLARKVLTTEHDVGVPELAGVVYAFRDKPDEVRVLRRGEAAFEVRRCRGVLAPMLFRPDGPRLLVVVAVGGVVSLHMARIDKAHLAAGAIHHALVVESPEIAFEPTRLKHYESDTGLWMVTRWGHPDGDPRWAWVPIPPKPATDDEAIDRILARFEARIRRKLWDFLSGAGRTLEPLILVMSVPDLGDGLDVVDRRAAADFARMHPAIVRAIKEHAAPGRVPVWVFMGKMSGLRWFELRADQDVEEPLRVVEPLRVRLQVVEPAADEDDTSNADDAAEPRLRRDTAEVWDLIMEQGIVAEINLRLLPLTGEQLDQEIAKVGFDPKVERETPWLKESVIEAMQSRRWEENPPK
ncbi:MAG: hypothetical protein ACLP1X_00990 [Polyangiaceae bacterium]|jgi:hypothetical protein